MVLEVESYLVCVLVGYLGYIVLINENSKIKKNWNVKKFNVYFSNAHKRVVFKKIVLMRKNLTN